MSGELLVLVDAGNTNLVFGFVRDDEWVRLRLSTVADRTADEHRALLLPLLDREGLDPGRVTAVRISSVVPPLEGTLARLSRELFGVEASFVEDPAACGMPLDYPHPEEIGADRIVNSLAARHLHGAPVVVVDFGTATTFDVVNAAGAYAGGLISPGLGISAEALFARASRLFRVDLRKPETFIGTSTAGAMQSGIFWGYVGQVDGILARLKSELGELQAVIATGGLAALIAESSEHITAVDPELTLRGLKLIHDRSA